MMTHAIEAPVAWIRKYKSLRWQRYHTATSCTTSMHLDRISCSGPHAPAGEKYMYATSRGFCWQRGPRTIRGSLGSGRVRDWLPQLLGVPSLVPVLNVAWRILQRAAAVLVREDAAFIHVARQLLPIRPLRDDLEALLAADLRTVSLRIASTTRDTRGIVGGGEWGSEAGSGGGDGSWRP